MAFERYGPRGSAKYQAAVQAAAQRMAGVQSQESPTPPPPPSNTTPPPPPPPSGSATPPPPPTPLGLLRQQMLSTGLPDDASPMQRAAFESITESPEDAHYASMAAAQQADLRSDQEEWKKANPGSGFRTTQTTDKEGELVRETEPVGAGGWEDVMLSGSDSPMGRAAKDVAAEKLTAADRAYSAGLQKLSEETELLDNNALAMARLAAQTAASKPKPIVRRSTSRAKKRSS